MLRFHRMHYLSDIFFSFTSMLTDAMRSMDVSRVLQTRLFRIPAPRITCHRLVYSYVSFPSYVFSLTCMCVQIWTVDSSPDTCLFPVSPFVLSTRVLTFSRLCLSSFVSLTRLFTRLILDSDSSTTHFPFTSICTCISQTIIYTGWRWDCSPSSIYFATTLKV